MILERMVGKKEKAKTTPPIRFCPQGFDRKEKKGETRRGKNCSF